MRPCTSNERRPPILAGTAGEPVLRWHGYLHPTPLHSHGSAYKCGRECLESGYQRVGTDRCTDHKYNRLLRRVLREVLPVRPAFQTPVQCCFLGMQAGLRPFFFRFCARLSLRFMVGSHSVCGRSSMIVNGNFWMIPPASVEKSLPRIHCASLRGATLMVTVCSPPFRYLSYPGTSK